MARKKNLIMAAWVLLTVCLLVGAGGSEARAGDDSSLQLVVVLDPHGQAPGNKSESQRLLEAASLLIHLLKEQDYLALIAPGEGENVMLTMGRLTREHRAQALERLAKPVEGAFPKPLAERVEQALGILQTTGPARRAVLILSGGGQESDRRSQTAPLEDSRRAADLARSQGVTILAATLSPAGISEELKTLAPGGGLREGTAAADLTGTMLNLYQRLAQPQEVPLSGGEFRLDQWVKRAVVVASRSGTAPGVVLTSPAGSRINPKTTAVNVNWRVGQGYDLITIIQPRPGTWRLAGARGADSRVLVDSDLILTTAGTPREVGADEVIQVNAALAGVPDNAAGADLMAGTEFRALLQAGEDRSLIAPLPVPEPGTVPGLPPGARMGRFAPLHHQGEATLSVLALGKSFQRLVSLPISIREPWYRIAMPPAEGQKMPIIRFEPDPARRAGDLRGTVTLQSDQGGLSGVLVNPFPGAEIILTSPAGCQEGCRADLHLRGLSPDGRPLAIVSGPVPKTSPKITAKPAAGGPEAAAPDDAKALPARKGKRRLLWMALMGMGLAVLVAAGLLLWRERPASEDAEVGKETGGNILMLQAQLENLNKDKAELQAALEEKNRHAANLLEEKADLQADLERVSAQTKGNIHSIEELEKKLEVAEQEAQGVQQEYMALYARNQQEKEEFKKK